MGTIPSFFRILIPTWRFFDTVGGHAELWVKIEGKWQMAIARPRFRWYSLFFNPTAGYYHACHNLLDRLVQEVGAGHRPEDLVSFALVRDLAVGREFKVTVDGEDVLRSSGEPS